MGLFIFAYIDFLTVRSSNNIEVRNVYFLENNFWCADKKDIESDIGHLFRVAISVEGERGKYVGVYHDSTTCHFFKHTNLRYIVLDESLTEEINSIKKSSKGEKLFLKLQFLFTDEPIKDDGHFKIYKGKRRGFITYKLVEKKIDNNFNLISDGIEIRKHHIKERFKEFVYIKKLLKLDEYIIAINEKNSNEIFKDLKDDSKFKLYFFKNYSECLKNFVEFVKNLKYFNLIEDSSNNPLENQNYKRFIDKKTTLKVYQFKKRLIKMFDERQSELQFNCSEISKILKAVKSLFIKCCEYLKDEIISKNILLPIVGKYKIEYYLDQIFDHIFISLKTILPQINTNNNENLSLIFDDLISSLEIYIEELQLTAVKDLCESRYVLKHFSTLLKREIETLEDFFIFEKIVIDYCNTFVYVVNNVFKIEDPSCDVFPYLSPIYIDDYKCRIVEGYEVNFEFPKNFVQIKAFDNEGNEFLLKKDIDYFTDKFNRFYSTVDVLKRRMFMKLKLFYPK